MSSKLRIRIADVEIDYEESEQFLKQELPALLRTAMELHKASGAKETDQGGSDAGEKEKRDVRRLTPGTIAARRKAKSGPELLLSAAAHLTFVVKKDTFSRQELLTDMKDATAYYKKSYSNNLTKYLNNAVDEGKLQETAKNAYALSADVRSKLEQELADS